MKRARPSVSVVVPTLREGARIADQVRRLLAQAGVDEVIVADAHSDDGTAELAAQAGAVVVHAPPGRARQLNAGAARATGEVLLFVHADVVLPDDAISTVHATLATPGTVAGAFRTWTTQDSLAGGNWRFGPIFHLADLRSRVTRYPYGDQALFLRRSTFADVGGYPDEALMEDLALAYRLAAVGRVALAPTRVQVSGRRWQQRPWLTTFLMTTYPTAWRLGVPTKTLAAFYAAIR